MKPHSERTKSRTECTTRSRPFWRARGLRLSQLHLHGQRCLVMTRRSVACAAFERKGMSALRTSIALATYQGGGISQSSWRATGIRPGFPMRLSSATTIHRTIPMRLWRPSPGGLPFVSSTSKTREHQGLRVISRMQFGIARTRLFCFLITTTCGFRRTSNAWQDYLRRTNRSWLRRATASSSTNSFATRATRLSRVCAIPGGCTKL